jgi:hypothetical protein
MGLYIHFPIRLYRDNLTLFYLEVGIAEKYYLCLHFQGWKNKSSRKLEGTNSVAKEKFIVQVAQSV